MNTEVVNSMYLFNNNNEPRLYLKQWGIEFATLPLPPCPLCEPDFTIVRTSDRSQVRLGYSRYVFP